MIRAEHGGATAREGGGAAAVTVLCLARDVRWVDVYSRWTAHRSSDLRVVTWFPQGRDDTLLPNELESAIGSAEGTPYALFAGPDAALAAHAVSTRYTPGFPLVCLFLLDPPPPPVAPDTRPIPVPVVVFAGTDPATVPASALSWRRLCASEFTVRVLQDGATDAAAADRALLAALTEELQVQPFAMPAVRATTGAEG